MHQIGLIIPIKPHKMVFAIIPQRVILSILTRDITMAAVVAPHIAMMTRVTKNAADQILEAEALLEEATRGLLAQAREALVALTTGMLTLKLSHRFMSLLSKGSLEKMILDVSLESSVILKK